MQHSLMVMWQLLPSAGRSNVAANSFGSQSEKTLLPRQPPQLNRVPGWCRVPRVRSAHCSADSHAATGCVLPPLKHKLCRAVKLVLFYH